MKAEKTKKFVPLVFVEFTPDKILSGYGGNGYSFDEPGKVLEIKKTEADRIINAYPANFKEVDKPKAPVNDEDSEEAPTVPDGTIRPDGDGQPDGDPTAGMETKDGA